MPAIPPPARASRFRWVICALIFFEITINYVDRLVFGLLAPELQKIFHWNNAAIPDIAFWFEMAYALGLAFVGRLLDRVGTRLGLALSLAGWCLASVLHAGMSTVLGFKVARFFLGLTESGAFPGATKATAEWFPRKERAIVAGIFNSGSNVGAIVAPLAVPWLFVIYGWQWAFIATGGIGLVWLTPSTGSVAVIVPTFDVGIYIPMGNQQFHTANPLTASSSAFLHQGFAVLLGRDVLASGLLNYDGKHNVFTLSF